MHFLTGSLYYLFHKLHKKFTFAMKYLAWHKVNKVKKGLAYYTVTSISSPIFTI